MEDSSSVTGLTCIPLTEIEEARENLKGRIQRTPLIPLTCGHDNSCKIYLKLENLQPTGSFKQRGAGNALQCVDRSKLTDEHGVVHGVYTSSAGNFAQGLAWNAREMNIPCSIVVPASAPETKVKAIKRFGGHVVTVPYDTWWQVMQTHHYEGVPGHFIHPVCNRHVIAGNGTIGLEILQDLPDVDTIIGPFGGGGMLTGIASAMKALKPDVKVYACEVETAAPLQTSLNVGKPSEVVNHKSSFVDGMGGKSLFPEMWGLASNLLAGSVVLSLQDIADAVRMLMVDCHLVAEGAGAAPVAAAIKGKVPGKNIVCVISGGNIDSDKLMTILKGEIP